MTGALPSAASTGVLWVSPSLMQKVAFWPSASLSAPQPPPDSSGGKWKDRPVAGSRPKRRVAARSA